MAEITIPDSVKEIKKYAFYNSGISSIVIPKSVTAIGLYAFQECKMLKEATIMGAVKKMDSTFEQCRSLETVTFGNKVKATNGEAFSYCDALKTINVPSGTSDHYCQLLPANLHILIVELPAEEKK